MKNIPPDGIYYDDALVIVFRMLNPDTWPILEERLDPRSPYYREFPEQADKDRENCKAHRAYDKAWQTAREWLQERTRQGILVRQILDPKTGREVQLHRDKDIQYEPTTSGGQPVYFDRKSFDDAVNEIAQPKTGISKPPRIDKGGRPPEYNWDAMKAFALEQIRELGKPHRNNKRLPSKAQLIEAIQRKWASEYDQEPSASLVRWHLNQWLAEIDGN